MESTVNSKRKSINSRSKFPVPEASLQEPCYTATEAKNEFGRLLDRAVQGATVVITKHDAPRAVLISVEKFNALQRVPQMNLDALSAEFDDLLAHMQSTSARGAMERAFNATPAQLGKAAVRAARKRG